MLKPAAIVKNTTSRTKLLFATLNGRVIAMDPATTAVINPAAPINSPTARLPLFVLNAAKVEKTSGEPFPKARKVTPAKDSERPSSCEMVDRFGQKKSLAAIPIVENRRQSHNVNINRATGCACGMRQ